MEDDIKMITILILLLICILLSGAVFVLYAESREDTKEIEYLKKICEVKEDE